MRTIKFAKRVARLLPSSTLAITSRAASMRKEGVDVVNFGAGEPDFDTPSNIKRAATEAISRGFTKYTPASGTLDLKRAVSDTLRKDNSLRYKPEEIVITCGAKHALYNIFQVLCGTGDEVLVIAPFWVSYPEMVTLAGARPRFVRVRESDGFVPDPADLEKNITARTKAVIINTPSNPTGAVFGKKVLAKIAKIAVRKRIFVISDEIYEKLIYDGEKHVSIGSLNKEIFRNTLTVNGVSKTYSMTGWRIGYVAGPSEIIKKISALQSHSTSNPSSISQMAALEALRGSQKKVLCMKKEFAERRDYMTRRINSFGRMSCMKPSGAFYIFCNTAGTGLGSVELCSRLLSEAHVACVPGIAFGSDSHIRLSFATGMKNIKTGLDRITAWLDKL